MNPLHTLNCDPLHEALCSESHCGLKNVQIAAKKGGRYTEEKRVSVLVVDCFNKNIPAFQMG